jgi:hypothetical protein
VAAGEPSAVAALTRWLWSGPPAARVAAVEIEEYSGSVPSGFGVTK